MRVFALLGLSLVFLSLVRAEDQVKYNDFHKKNGEFHF